MALHCLRSRPSAALKPNTPGELFHCGVVSRGEWLGILRKRARVKLAEHKCRDFGRPALGKVGYVDKRTTLCFDRFDRKSAVLHPIWIREDSGASCAIGSPCRALDSADWHK